MKYIKCEIIGRNILRMFFLLNREFGQIVLKVPSDFLTGYENLGQKSFGRIKISHIDLYVV